MASVENFAEYPMSVGERRSEKEQSAAKWKPRDAIISMLRRIDKGEVRADAVMIVVREQDATGTRTFYSNATPDIHTALGMLEHLKYRMLAGK